MNPIRRSISQALGLSLLTGPTVASTYPDRPVKVIVAFPASGPADIVSRVMAQHLSTALGQQFVVENRTGAGGTIGTGAVAQSPADGYTLLGTAAAHATMRAYYPSISWDPVKSFAGVIEFGRQPTVVVVNATSNIRTLDELIKVVKAQGGKTNYAAGGGGGSLTALIGHSFMESAGITGQQIAFRGSAFALQAVLSGDVLFDVDLPAGMMGMLTAGKLRPLAVTSKQRYKPLPDVPTVAELIDPQFEFFSWNGLLAPSGTPAAIVQRLNAAANAILASPDVQRQFETLGFTPTGGSSAHFNAVVEGDAAKNGALIRKFGLSVN